jgi:hypothetical protein
MSAHGHSCTQGPDCKGQIDGRNFALGCLHHQCPNIPPQRVFCQFAKVEVAANEQPPSPAPQPSEAEQRRAAFKVVT